MFVLPSLLFILLVNIYPLFSGIAYSFSNKELLGSGTFIGLKNYIDVIQSADFRNSIGFTLTFSISGVLGSFVFGLLAALLLNCNIPARSFFRSALLLPWIVRLLCQQHAGDGWFLGHEYYKCCYPMVWR